MEKQRVASPGEPVRNIAEFARPTLADEAAGRILDQERAETIARGIEEMVARRIENSVLDARAATARAMMELCGLYPSDPGASILLQPRAEDWS